MSPDDIKKAREIISAATPGPWFTDEWYSGKVRYNGNGIVCQHVHSQSCSEFIAAARTGWPEALDHVEFLQKEILGYWAEWVAKLRAENEELRARLVGCGECIAKAKKQVLALLAVAEAAQYLLDCSVVDTYAFEQRLAESPQSLARR